MTTQKSFNEGKRQVKEIIQFRPSAVWIAQDMPVHPQR
jgi:hypothetical protein